MGRRHFDPEYRLRVARMVVDEGRGVPQVVRDTGVWSLTRLSSAYPGTTY